MKSVQKSLKKQQQTITTNPGEGWEFDFLSCHIIILKMSIIQQKNYEVYKETRHYETHNGKKLSYSNMSMSSDVSMMAK